MLIDIYGLFRINSKFIVNCMKIVCFSSSLIKIDALTNNNPGFYNQNNNNEPICKCLCCVRKYENSVNSNDNGLKNSSSNNYSLPRSTENKSPTSNNNEQMMKSIIEMNKLLLNSNESIPFSISTKSIFKSLPNAIEVTLLLETKGSSNDEALNIMKTRKENIKKSLANLGFSRKQIIFFNSDPKVNCYNVTSYLDPSYVSFGQKLPVKKNDANKNENIKINKYDQKRLFQSNKYDDLEVDDENQNMNFIINNNKIDKDKQTKETNNKYVELIELDQNSIQYSAKTKINVVANSVETFIKIVKLAKDLDLQIAAKEYGDNDYIDDYEKSVIRAMAWGSNLDKFLLLVDSMGMSVKSCNAINVSEPYRINNNVSFDNIIREIAEFNYDQADISELDFILKKMSKTYCANVHFNVSLGIKNSDKIISNQQIDDTVKSYQDEFLSEGLGYSYSYDKTVK